MAILRHGVWCVLLWVLTGCAMVSLKQQDTREYVVAKRADVLTAKHLSAAAMEVVQVVGLSQRECERQLPQCIEQVQRLGLPQKDAYLAAMSELWLLQAKHLSQNQANSDAYHDALLGSARFAYAYLFFGERAANQRVLEYRQMQVADYYNFAVQTYINDHFNQHSAEGWHTNPQSVVKLGDWEVALDLSHMRLPQNVAWPDRIAAATNLKFVGLRNVYQRDGFGAELVAMVDADAPEQRGYSEMSAAPLTAILHFSGGNLNEVLQTKRLLFQAFDPFEFDTIVINQQKVPLAANFTAAYGVWLADSGFAKQSLRTLLGKEGGIDKPHVYLMQPYDPNRRIILMVHGLASSPEAWVNVANELLGDAKIREHFQIWQVYYPSNMPIALNHVAIREEVQRTLHHFDAHNTQQASKDMVVVGHSMGGIISRMLISNDNHALDTWFKEALGVDAIPVQLQPLVRFEPMPEIGRVVFIAAPHQGTRVAGGKVGKLVSKAVRLPIRTLRTLDQGLSDAFSNNKNELRRLQQQGVLVPNSIDNLDENDRFIQASQNLRLSPTIPYHSIIAKRRADMNNENGNDGVVPYSSAHLPQAQSEKVIVSWHSVQENPQAILEIRRILHLDMRQHQP